MSHNNYTTQSKKFKSLEEYEHGIIENCLNNNEKTGKIAEKLYKDVSTIKKAITRYSTKYCASPKCSQCLEFENCAEKNLCGIGKDRGYCTSRCKECKVSLHGCEKYNPKIECIYLKGHRKVCNGCKNFKQCRKPKLIYKAKEAISKQQFSKKNSRRTKAISKLSFENRAKYDEYVSPMIKKQLSISVVVATMKEEIKEILNVSITTLYKYIDAGELNCMNIDLLNKVKRKLSNHENIKPNRTKNRANGRSVHDLTEEENKADNLFEMDTVEGVKGGKLFLTMITMKQHFMLGLPINNKKQDDVIYEIDKLESTLGAEKFNSVFGIGKTDNGCEFLDYNGIENSIVPGRKRMKLHYADPYASYQKALVENNHRIIRYILEKGYDFSSLNTTELISIMNRVNNYPRKCLNYSTPYLEMIKVIDEETLGKLGFYYISIENLDMKTKKAA